MDNQQDSEAIERRRTQNRIAQRKHRQRRAQLLRDYQNHDRRSKEGRIEDYDQEPQQESGEDANQPFSGSKVPQVPFDSQASKECINCQCERNARTANELSQEAESTSNSSQPLNTLDPASSFENNVTVSSVQNESRANESPSVVRVNGVVLPSPKGYISPSFHNNDNQYYLDATASLEDDDDFLGSILGSTDYIETTDTDTRRVGNQIQSIDSVVVSLEDVSNPKTRPRSASHCYSGTKTFQATNPRVIPPRRATFTALASPPISEEGPPIRTSHIVRKHHKGKTALHLCAERGNEKIVRLLVVRGAAMDAQDSLGRTALHYAARNAHYNVVRTLLQSGADTEILDGEGYSALHVAAEVGSEDVITLLTQEGADLNSRIGMDGYQRSGSIIWEG